MKKDVSLTCPSADTDISERVVGSVGRRPVLVALAMLAGGGWLGIAGGLAEAKAAEDAAEEGGEGSAYGGEGAEESAAGPEYVELEWIMVQARQPNGRRRNLSLLLTLEVAAGGDTGLVAGKRRQLRDAYLIALSSPPLVQSGRQRVDIAEVKARLAKASTAVLGENVVAGVLIRDINDFGAR